LHKEVVRFVRNELNIQIDETFSCELKTAELLNEAGVLRIIDFLRSCFNVSIVTDANETFVTFADIYNRVLEELNVVPSQSIRRKQLDNEISPIIPRLFMGSDIGARSLESLKKINVKYIINCASECQNHHSSSDISYLNLNLKDDRKENIREAFERSFEFIQMAISENSAIFVHCHAGISRSAAIIIGFLMMWKKMTLSEAFRLTRSMRPIVNPNPSYLTQLEAYDLELSKSREESLISCRFEEHLRSENPRQENSIEISCDSLIG